LCHAMLRLLSVGERLSVCVPQRCFTKGWCRLGNETLHQFPNNFSLHPQCWDMILAIVLHLTCVHTVLLKNSSTTLFLYLLLSVAFGIFQLLLQIKELELK